MAGRGCRTWILGIGGGLVAVIIVAAVAFVVLTRNPTPGGFYDPPDDLDAAPGTILRSEPFAAGVPAGARGWTVLYASTDSDGRPIAVSGLILAPADPREGTRPVLAWAHGTTGIARPCAPSLTSAPLDGIPDLASALAEGWVVALTDYPGLGTPGPHPYLVGESEGRAVLDSVRAAHQLDTGAALDDRYAVWGHSQGGHAALFAGQLASAYLPDLQLVGIAALAPATRLEQLLEAAKGTEAGNVLTIFAVESWTDYYPDIPDDTLTREVRGTAERIGKDCINQPSRFRLALEGFTLPRDIVAIDPTSDPTWTARLAENSPDPAGVVVPLLVAQGLTDEIVAPAITEAWTADRCVTGAPTDWRTFPDVDHTAIVGPGGAAAFAWTADRFDGRPPAQRCPSAPTAGA